VLERRAFLQAMFSRPLAAATGTGLLLEDLSAGVRANKPVPPDDVQTYLAQAAMALMKRQSPRGGRIINNGSISAHAPRPNSVAYTATKHAITGLTKCISLDGRPFDIACGQIDIGNAATEMTDRMTKGVMQAHGVMAVEPRMDVHDVARAIVFMAGLSLDSHVQFMTLLATKMPFVGRG